MKNLTRTFFCIFAVAFFCSCEPEELPQSSKPDIPFDEGEEYGHTGDQKDDIDDDKE